MYEQLPPPDALKTPVKNTSADAMISLGVLTAACETVGPDKKSKCQELLVPLEQNRQSAVETLTNVIVELGEEGLDDALDRFNFLIFEAAAKAKEILQAQGKIDKNGIQINTQ